MLGGASETWVFLLMWWQEWQTPRWLFLTTGTVVPQFYRKTFREAREHVYKPKISTFPNSHQPLDRLTNRHPTTTICWQTPPKQYPRPFASSNLLYFPALSVSIQRWRGPETSIWYSASPRRGDEVDPRNLLNPVSWASEWVGDGEQKRFNLRFLRAQSSF